RKPGGKLGVLWFQMTGTIWEGGSYDPETHMAYVFSKDSLYPQALTPPDPCGSDLAYVMAGRPPQPPRHEVGRPPRQPGGGGRGDGEGGEGGGGLSVKGLPLNKPPYGTITAIDLTKGDIAWQIPHGDTPDNIKNHPDLKGLNIPRTGRPGTIGTL